MKIRFKIDHNKINRKIRQKWLRNPGTQIINNKKKSTKQNRQETKKFLKQYLP